MVAGTSHMWTEEVVDLLHHQTVKEVKGLRPSSQVVAQEGGLRSARLCDHLLPTHSPGLRALAVPVEAMEEAGMGRWRRVGGWSKSIAQASPVTSGPESPLVPAEGPRLLGGLLPEGNRGDIGTMRTGEAVEWGRRACQSEVESGFHPYPG